MCLQVAEQNQDLKPSNGCVSACVLEEVPPCLPGKLRELLPAQDTQKFCSEQALPSICLALVLGVTLALVIWICPAVPGRTVNSSPSLHPRGTHSRCAHLAFWPSHLGTSTGNTESPVTHHLQATQNAPITHKSLVLHLLGPSHPLSIHCKLISPSGQHLTLQIGY